jgi:hypothetical protein
MIYAQESLVDEIIVDNFAGGGGAKGGPMKPSHKEIAATLREYAEWADANIYEVPIMLPDDLRTAADMLEKGE